MSIQQVFGLVAGFLSLAGFVPYVIAVLRGRSSPSRTTWMIWMLVGAMLCASQWESGARETIWMALSYVLGPLVIVWLSFRFGTGGWSMLDRYCLAVSAGSAFLWAITGQPLVALLLNIAVDACGALPTLAKLWRDPDSEDLTAWSCFAIAAALNLVAAWPWKLDTLIYPAYLFVVAMSVMALSLRRRPIAE